MKSALVLRGQLLNMKYDVDDDDNGERTHARTMCVCVCLLLPLLEWAIHCIDTDEIFIMNKFYSLNYINNAALFNHFAFVAIVPYSVFYDSTQTIRCVHSFSFYT